MISFLFLSSLFNPTSISFCPCLPGVPGGAFYTPETIDTARLHYRNSWAPILHAVALWLHSTGFGSAEGAEENPPAPPKGSAPAAVFPPGGQAPNKSQEELVKDRMHLLLGKS